MKTLRAARLGLPIAALAVALAGCSSPRELVKPTPLTEIANETPPKVVWSESAGGDQENDLTAIAPVEADGRVFVAGPDGEVLAYELASGDRLWTADLDAELSVGGGASADLVVFGSDDGRVFALDAESGKTSWTTSIGSTVDAAPSVGFGDVAVRGRDGTLAVLNAATGEERWRQSRSQPALTLQGQGRVLMFPDALAAGFDDGTLAVFAREDGKELWSQAVALPSGRTDVDRMVDVDATPVFADGVFYAASYQGKLAALAAQGGQQLWSRSFSNANSIAAGSRALYLSDAEGIVWAIDRRSGDALWRQADLAHRGLTGPALIDGYLVIGDREGYVHVLSSTSGALVGRSDWGDPLIDPILQVDGKGVAVTRDGQVRAFTLE
ncbi:MAG: outer membrane protein assembly factor BamB [Halothiobacillaceae bacterium]|nr:outer membrane protein assembly factor BamB [Halothiobacillaceae bacterium]HER20451.1 outer membrane protein assembly factor BamB [Chromatiales bacterium]